MHFCRTRDLGKVANLRRPVAVSCITTVAAILKKICVAENIFSEDPPTFQYLLENKNYQYSIISGLKQEQPNQKLYNSHNFKSLVIHPTTHPGTHPPTKFCVLLKHFSTLAATAVSTVSDMPVGWIKVKFAISSGPLKCAALGFSLYNLSDCTNSIPQIVTNKHFMDNITFIHLVNDISIVTHHLKKDVIEIKFVYSNTQDLHNYIHGSIQTQSSLIKNY
ncbi:hypothetical protein AGLY_008482 [Aphis glycines]|uniref:Uncharacterized protein n=1 Tax=Aphis glycines TaxID=307491 RepID=A0A6G0TK77_APHGL|nr:hypothetical protein AGLY_008482 [Aphis glycines]